MFYPQNTPVQLMSVACSPSSGTGGSSCTPMRYLRGSLLSIALVLISACGSGSSNNPSSGFGAPLSVNAGENQTASAGSTVLLSGVATSASNESLSYQWSQLSGPVVSLSNADTAVASFVVDASLISGSACVTLVFRLTVSNANGNRISADTTVSLLPTGGGSCVGTALAASGQLSYDRIPATASGILDFSSISIVPIRGVSVELVDSNGLVLGTGQSDSNGNYAVTSLFDTANTAFAQLRVMARLQSTSPMWDVSVIDNTQANAIYALVSPLTAVPSVTSGSATVSLTFDLHAGSGWDGSAYTGARAAGPFAIVDTLYGGLQSLAAAVGGFSLVPFTVRWSVSNTSVDGNPSLGEVGGTYYDGVNQITLLGSALADTDEYDAPVVLHEFGHHFEATASRSDSIGGPHAALDRLDMTVAFGEGMATALGAMLSGEVLYFDSSGLSGGFSFSVETIDSRNAGAEGWFNEDSVTYILYDLFDAQDEAGIDTVTLGLLPIYDVLVNEHRTGIPFNSIFTFITALKAKQPSQVAAIDTLVADQSINSAAIDAYGSSETNSAGQGSDVLPVYTRLIVSNATATATVTSTCISTEFGSYNKLSNRRFFRIDTFAGATYDIEIQLASGTQPAGTESYLVLSSTNAHSCVTSSFSGSCGRLGNGTFRFSSSSGGTHVMVLYEASARAQGTGNTCYTTTALLP